MCVIGQAFCQPDSLWNYHPQEEREGRGLVRSKKANNRQRRLLALLPLKQARRQKRGKLESEPKPPIASPKRQLMPTYRYHPACLLFPKLSPEELQELAEDIKARGLLHDIVRYKGMILDGRNRLAACKIAGVKPRFAEWDGKGSPVEWVISENLIRRHLTSSQRAVIALDLLPLLETEAKERQRLSAGRGKKGANQLATSSNGTGKASQIAARLTKTNSAYVEAVKSIKKQAPELVEKIRSGDLRIPDASQVAKLPAAERKQALRKIEKGESVNGSNGSYVFQAGDLGNLRPTNINTPPGVARFMHDVISPAYKVRTILDPCCGKGALTRPWKNVKTIAYEATKGKDFFKSPDRIACDLVLCNPPFAGNGKTRQSPVSMFLERILAVVPSGTPTALIAHWSFRMDQEYQFDPMAVAAG